MIFLLGRQSKILLKFVTFATFAIITRVLSDEMVDTKNHRLPSVITSDRRLDSGEDIDKMTGRNYHLKLSGGSVLRGITSKFKVSRGPKRTPFREFESIVWEPFSNVETSETTNVAFTPGDQTFELKCPDDMFITGINGVYFSQHQDQIFKFGCTRFRHVSRVDCDWSSYANDVNKKEDFTFQCNEDKVIAGVKSIRDTNIRDRSFSFYCCEQYFGEGTIWLKEKVEGFTKKISSRYENSKKNIINFFKDTRNMASKCDKFEKNFEVNVCAMEGGTRRRNRRGFEEMLNVLAEVSEVQTTRDAFEERTNEEVEECKIDHLILPKTARANFLKEITVLLADPSYDEKDFDDAQIVLNKFKRCTEGMLHFSLKVERIHVNVSNKHWGDAAYEVMTKAKEELGMAFNTNTRLNDNKNTGVVFNMEKHMTMIVLPDDVNFDDKYGFALMHSGLSVMRASETKDGRYVLHELGHNLGMMHSTTIDNEYGDDRCIMGHARSKRTCFNGAKSYYLGLYRHDTAIVHAHESNCEATLILADLQKYLFEKRDIYKTHGTFYVIAKVPDKISDTYKVSDTYLMYYAEDETISAVKGEIGDIKDEDADDLYYAKTSTRLFELKPNEEKKYNGIYYEHCPHSDKERVATLYIRSHSGALCPPKTSERFNLALGRPSRLSSLYNGYTRALNGNDGELSYSMVHSLKNKYEYWEVTFASDKSLIDEVIIYNRVDSQESINRILGGKVEILNSKDKVIATKPITHSSYEIKLDFGGIEGAAVRISPRSYQFLNFHECVVNGREYLGVTPSAIPPLFTKVTAREFLYLKGPSVKIHHDIPTNRYFVSFITNNSVLFSKLCNFGEKGTTKSIQFSISKGNDGGYLEVRLDDVDGQLLGTFYPTRTGVWMKSWGIYSITINDVHGVHNVIFVGKVGDSRGITSIEWFQLSA